jgi:hypothetical protein
MTKGEIINAILKGLGRRPTANLLRWSPTFKNPIAFDLLEVFRCQTDGELVTTKIAQTPRHGGHTDIRTPGRYSWFEFLKVQLRIIR